MVNLLSSVISRTGALYIFTYKKLVADQSRCYDNYNLQCWWLSQQTIQYNPYKQAVQVTHMLYMTTA